MGTSVCRVEVFYSSRLKCSHSYVCVCVCVCRWLGQQHVCRTRIFYHSKELYFLKLESYLHLSLPYVVVGCWKSLYFGSSSLYFGGSFFCDPPSCGVGKRGSKHETMHNVLFYESSCKLKLFPFKSQVSIEIDEVANRLADGLCGTTVISLWKPFCYLLYALKISGICKWFEYPWLFWIFLVTYGSIWFVCQSFRQQRSLSLSLKKNPSPYQRPQRRNLQPSVKRRNKVSKFQAQRRAYDIVDMPLSRLSHCSTVALMGFNNLFVCNVD